jgi:hypothetical protein
MTALPKEIKLSDLRGTFGEKPKSDFYEWAYRPAVIRAKGGIIPQEQIRILVNEQSLEEVCDQFDTAVKQLLFRAHLGEERAARLYLARVSSAIVSLEPLVSGQMPMMKVVAATLPRWPVLLSLNAKDIKHQKSRLTKLKVGSKAVTPTGPGQQSDLHSFWSELAKKAYDACEFNRHLVPFLMKMAADKPTQSRSAEYWQTDVNAKFYYLNASREVIIIADWQAKCETLPATVNTSSFPPWWAAVKGCVLEYWHNHPAEYNRALKEIGNSTEIESRRRNLAMTQLRQAFKSLVGLRRTKPAVP